MSSSKQLKDFYRIFAEHGSGSAKVQISPEDVVLLIHIAYHDLHPEEKQPNWFLPEFERVCLKDFFLITPSEIDALPNLSVDEAIEILKISGTCDPQNVIYLYLKNLSELFRRRYKFLSILSHQPFPQTEQIGPRSLLEYGRCDNQLLFNWMLWRKWIYDIDNRSAQETGYLFEPILVSCLGGETVSHSRSPVKRINESGNKTNNGRQLDCYLPDKKEAYELKMRVTMAASGQGRFNEEMSFPAEAASAGIKPILVVFDPTPSILLEQLATAYKKAGGASYIGKEAWDFLEKEAGFEMGRFIAKYIRPPICEIEKLNRKLPIPLRLEVTSNSIVITDSEGRSYRVERTETNFDEED